MGPEDYAALCDMYHKMNGAGWYQPWNIDSDMIDGNNWRGVTFIDTHVSEINLNGRGVRGHIPPSVLSLSTLEQLDLSNNSLDWDVQDLADTLAKHAVEPTVSSLILNANRLRGDISVLADAFPGLETLNLSNNRFSELSRPLSDAIKSLSIYYQQVSVEEVQTMRLAVKQHFDLPTISPILIPARIISRFLLWICILKSPGCMLRRLYDTTPVYTL